ncbi:MAG: hypothetical protein Q9164_001126 [Protoblastenia rupestris]
MAMQTQTIHADVPSTPGTELDLDESTLLSSLAHLQQLHIALRSLRETLPTLTSSVIPSPSSPEHVYQNFSHAAHKAGKNIKDFTTLMKETRSKEVFEKASENKSRDGEGIGVWQVAEHADWLEVVREKASEDTGVVNADTEERGAGASIDTMKAAMEGFRERNPGIEVNFDDDEGKLKIDLPSPANMAFKIETQPVTGKPGYLIKSQGKTKLQRAVTDTANERHGGHGLGYILVLWAVSCF